MKTIKQIYWKFLKKRENKYKKIWQQSNNPKGLTTPVFLTGCARSGTTMTANVLAKSLEVDFYSDGNSEAFNQWYLRDFYTIFKLIKNSSANIVTFHTNNELLDTPCFLEKYPSSKAIFIFRNYMDVVNSTLRNRWEWVKGQAVFDLYRLANFNSLEIYKNFFDLLGEFPDTNLKLEPGEWTKYSNYSPILESREGEAIIYAMRWLLYSRIPIDQGWLKDDRIYVVNYENLVDNPENYIRDLCKFLDIKYSSVMINEIHSHSVKKHNEVQLPSLLIKACEEAYRELRQIEQSKRQIFG